MHTNIARPLLGLTTLLMPFCFASAQMVDDGNRRSAADPKDVADIVARDIGISAFAHVGHVALSDGGGNVIEAVNKKPAIQENTLDSFKKETTYWGAIYYPDWAALPAVNVPDATNPDKQKSYPAKFAAFQHAYLVKQIGASYTLSPIPKPAQLPACNHCPPRKGQYRCDTFVKEALIFGGVPNLSFDKEDMPAKLWNDKRFELRR